MLNNCENKWLISLLSIVNIVMLIVIYFLCLEVGRTISTLQNNIDIYEQQNQEQVEILNENIINIAQLSFVNDLREFQLLDMLTNNLIKFAENQEKLSERLKSKFSIDLENVDNIKEANVYILNLSKGVSGSGTHIKINGLSYILTSAHLFEEEEEDTLLIKTDDGFYQKGTLIKIDNKTDLALLQIYNIDEVPYLEISDETPKEGSQVTVVGNPDDLKDVITEGVIAKVQEKGYIITNTAYFGNSGGALLYKGKIIGVISRLRIHYDLQKFVFVNYAYAPKLEIIKEFLKEINN